MLGSFFEQERSRPFRVICLALACFLFAARFAWELRFPLQPEQFKGLIYLRDLVIVPCGLLLLLGLPAFRNERFPNSRTFTAALAAMVVLLCALISIFVFRTRAQIPDEAIYLF